MKIIRMLAPLLVLCGCATSRVELTHEPTIERLRKIPVVAMEFQDAAMSDVVAYIAMNLHCVCHPMVFPQQTIQGEVVAYTIPFDTFDGEDPTCPKDRLKGTNETVMLRLGPAITLRVNDSTMLDVIQAVVRRSEGSLEIAEDLIRIRTKKVQPPVAHVQKGPAADPF